MPTVSALALSAGSFSTFCTSADNLSITAGGVPRGATRPFHTARSPRSTPVASNSDGSFGNGETAAVELGQRAQIARPDQRQLGRGAVEDEIGGAGQHALRHVGAAVIGTSTVSMPATSLKM